MEKSKGLIKFLLFIFFGHFVSIAQAQDIEQIIKKDPFKITGNLSFGGSMYQSSRDQDIRSPYSYYMQGSPTFSFYGFQIPVTISIRDSKLNFSKRLSRIGLNPKYKWVQLMLGANSYHFSPYTLSGQNINGIGIKLNPGKFQFTAMRGTMRNLLPQIDSLVYGKDILPIYQRKALGVKLGFNSSVANIELMAFKAKDEIDPPVAIQDSLNDILTPEENIVVGLKVESTIAHIFTTGISIGSSVFTNDHTNETVAIEEQYQELAQVTLVPTRSTRFSFAGDIYGQINVKGFNLGLKLKQVEPFYRSLGLFYMQDDYRNITLNTRFPLFERKLFISASYGVQRNNLRETRSRTNERNIRSLQVNYNSGSVFAFTANYSNFSQDQSPGLVAVDDTLRYAQVSNNITLSPRLAFTDVTKTQNLILSIMQFGLEDLSSFYDVPKSTKSRVINLNYNIRWKESGLGFKLAGNYNSNTSSEIESKRFGGTLGIRKKFNKKSSASIASTYNIRSTEGVGTGSVLNSRFSFRFTPQKKHRFSLNFGYVIRTFKIKENTNDLRARTAYVMSF